MSQYNGKYIKLADDPTYYAVDIGHKRLVESPTHMYQIGIRPIVVVTEEELDAIPFLVLPGDDEEE